MAFELEGPSMIMNSSSIYGLILIYLQFIWKYFSKVLPLASGEIKDEASMRSLSLWESDVWEEAVLPLTTCLSWFLRL